MAVLKTVSQLKDGIAGILSGVDLNQVDDLNGSIESAVSTFVQKADVPEASGIQNITLFSGVFDYPCTDEVFGTSLTDIRPQGVSRYPWDFAVKTDQETFDRTKGYYPSGTMAAFQYQYGVPILRIVAPFPVQFVPIDPMSSFGNWTVSGTASNLQIDQTVFYESPASLRFNLGIGTGFLSETLQGPLSLSNYQGVGTGFLAIQIPSGFDPANLTNITFNFGSDSSNYSSVSATQGFLGNWIANNWLLVAFDFSTATNTGTPNWSAMQYVNLAFTTTSGFTNFRTGGLFISLPSPAQILYQSSAVFIPTTTRIPQTTITSNDDTIIFSPAAYNIFRYEAALSVFQNTGGELGSALFETIASILNGARAKNGTVINAGLYDLYRGDNPSQEMRQVGSYYESGGNCDGGNDRW